MQGRTDFIGSRISGWSHQPSSQYGNSMKWTQSVLVLGVAMVAAGLVPVASRAAEFGRQYGLVAQASKPHSPVGQHQESGFSSTDRQTDLPAGREERQLEGWRVLISRRLLTDHAKATETAIELLSEQLREIVRVVPAAAVEKLKAVPLYLSPAYDGFAARAEYHPAAGWLRNHGRDPGMAKAVEFTNVLIFAAETRRMPNFALHELAHAYHDRELAEGYGNATVIECFERAKAAGNYERVQRQDAKGRLTMDRAYALTNPQEYFAEVTESFFSRNDFFPFCREELQQHDPQACRMLRQLWGCGVTPADQP